MPLTAKGEEIMAALKKEYGSEKGERVFYAMKNKGGVSGVDRADMNPGEFEELSDLLKEFFSEEAREPEHVKADTALQKADAAVARLDSYQRNRKLNTLLGAIDKAFGRKREDAELERETKK